jgi:beta-carotene/zeaxanthin 4-ketolase
LGIILAIIIISSWFVHLFFTLAYSEVNYTNPFLYLNIIIQVYLFTGLFITAHDSIHGTLSGNKLLNKIFGQVTAFLYACISYNRLVKNHIQHHRFSGTANDPDFSIESQNFFLWWVIFLGRYTTILQLIFMGLTYNVLKIWFSEINILTFWIIPAFISTFQLFFFGTYLPHRKPHTDNMQPHNTRSQKKNHLWAMISCYFFGYHIEHHSNPTIPWWQLYKTK